MKVDLNLPGVSEAIGKLPTSIEIIATRIEKGLYDVADAIKTHRVQVPQTKEEFAYQMIIASCSGGKGENWFANDGATLNANIDTAWKVMQECKDSSS